MNITLSEEKKNTALLGLQHLFRDSFDEDLSQFQAEILLEFFVSDLGPTVYNQAIRDARDFMLLKLEDLDAILKQRFTWWNAVRRSIIRKQRKVRHLLLGQSGIRTRGW